MYWRALLAHASTIPVWLVGHQQVLLHCYWCLTITVKSSSVCLEQVCMSHINQIVLDFGTCTCSHIQSHVTSKIQGIFLNVLPNIVADWGH